MDVNIDLTYIQDISVKRIHTVLAQVCIAEITYRIILNLFPMKNIQISQTNIYA